MGTKNPRKYTAEFKRQAVQLARELNSGPKAASQLGIPESNIHKWKVKEDEGTFSGASGVAPKVIVQPTLEEENRRLQRELAEQKKVNHILKLAAAFFSQDHLK